MTDLEKFLSECERLDKEATKGPWSAYKCGDTMQTALPLLVKMLREIIETQRARDMCSGPGPYQAFDPAGIAERTLKEQAREMLGVDKEKSDAEL